MGWNIIIRKPVIQALNALVASGKLSRRGLIHAYNSLRLELPKHVRRFQAARYAHDPDCFLFPVSFRDHGAWHRFVFYVNDAVKRGLLVIEDMEHNAR